MGSITDDDQDQRRKDWEASAGAWDAWFDTIEKATKPVSERMVALAGIGPGDRVLDVATGTGEPAVTAARRVAPDGHVVATDISPSMIAGAERRAAKLGVANITFRIAAAEHLDDPAASFDAALCRWGLMFMADIDGALRHMRGLIRDGGRLVAAAWAEPSEVPTLGIERGVLAPYFEDGHFAHGIDHLNAFRFAAPGLLETLMSDAGFRDVSSERVTVVYEFPSAETYTRFRREVSSTDAALAKRHPEDVVKAAWDAVAEAAGAHADAEGRIRMENIALCAVGTR